MAYHTGPRGGFTTRKVQIESLWAAGKSLETILETVGGLKSMLAEVAQHYGLSVEEIRERTNKHRISHARHAFVWYARQVKWADGRQRYSYPAIGRFLGQDHTTAIAGYRQHKKRMRLSTVSPTGLSTGSRCCVDNRLHSLEASEKQRTIVA